VIGAGTSIEPRCREPHCVAALRASIASLIRSRPSSCKRQPQCSLTDEELMRNIKML